MTLLSFLLASGTCTFQTWVKKVTSSLLKHAVCSATPLLKRASKSHISTPTSERSCSGKAPAPTRLRYTTTPVEVILTFSLSLCLSVCLSLSLSHTHTCVCVCIIQVHNYARLSSQMLSFHPIEGQRGGRGGGGGGGYRGNVVDYVGDLC